MGDLLTRLPTALSAAGLNVSVAKDAKTNRLRGSNLVDVRGIIVHTTETSSATFRRTNSDAPTLEWTRYGLGYPTYHVLIGRTGKIYVNTLGQGAHAGYGKWPVKGVDIPDDHANLYSIGISMDANGSDFPVTADQLEAAARVIKAIQTEYGPGLSVVMHGEYAPSRRSDPTKVDWDALRDAGRRGYWSNPTWPSKASASASSAKVVRITTAVLNVRSGPSTKYKVVRTVKRNEAFTIVEEKGSWGRLKSGAGWIHLSYVEEV